MKNTKQTLLSIAIIAALPFTANATQTIVETNTPAAVGANGTVKKAAATGPYQTATIGEHDDEHIATTAYVKGAYNDSIRAVNKTAQDTYLLIEQLGGSIAGIESDYVNVSILNGVIGDAMEEAARMDEQKKIGILNDIAGDYQEKMYNENGGAMGKYAFDADTFVGALASDPNAIATEETYFVSAGAVASGLLAQRVEIYTTWGTNNTTDVALKTVAPQN